MTEKELVKLKGEIDNAKLSMSKLQGQLETLTTQLKDTWDCDNIEEAEAKIEELETQIDDLNKKIETGVNEIREKYEDI